MDWEDIENNDYFSNLDKCFDCLGDVGVSEEHCFHQHSFIANREIELLFCESTNYQYNANTMKSVELFNYKFDIGTALTNHISTLFNLARKNLLLLDKISLTSTHLKSNSISDKSDYYELRVQITKLLYYIRIFIRQISACRDESLNYELTYCSKELLTKITAFRLSLKSLSDLPSYVISHSISKQGNKCTQAVYHLFHGHLEWRWLHLLFVFEHFKYGRENNVIHDRNNVSFINTSFEEYILLFIADLMAIAIGIFEKIQTNDVLSVTPFSCSCVRECWLLLQLLIEQLHSQDKSKDFWSYFNEVMRRVKESKTEIIELGDCAKLSLSYLQCRNATGFCIWLLVNIAKLHGFDATGRFIGHSSTRVTSNYEQLVFLMKAAIASDANITEQHLRIYINIISETLIKWWEPKNDIITLLWEYFQKRLNSSFFIQGSTPDTMAVCSKAAVGHLQLIKERLCSSSKFVSESSYNNFLFLLGKHFSRCREYGEMANWQRFKGRLYPKFPQNKLLSLSEMGLLNFSSLFLTLAISIDVKEIGMKLEDLLSQLPTEKLDNSCKAIIMKTHLALIVLNIENNIDIAYTITGLLDLVNGFSMGHNKDSTNALMRLFIEGFRDIIHISLDFELSEYMLIDVWIPKYLHSCSQNDQSKLLDILVTVLSKLHVLYQQTFSIGIQNCVSESDELSSGFTKVSQMLCIHVLPFLRQNATSSNSVSQVADMAVYFTLFTLYDQSLSARTGQNFSTLFKYFSQNENVTIRIVRRYLCRILADKDASCHIRDHIQNFESLVIQSWIKCCILCHEDFKNQEMKDLFMIIYEFHDIKQLCNYSNTSIFEADDTLCTLFNAIGSCYNCATTFQEKTHVREVLNSYLSVLEKHIIPLVKNPYSLELILRIYSVIAILFLHCSSLMYIRSKPSCLLHILLTQLVLPPSLFMDKKPHPYVLSAMRKTWHLYVKGLFYLDHKTDPYIDKTLKDLIVVYLPYFATKHNAIEKYSTAQPLQKLLGAEDSQDALLTFVYEKISMNYLVCRGKQVNQNSALVLSLLFDVIQKSRNETRIMKFFVIGLTYCLLEQIMFLEELSPSRKVACDIVQTIVGTTIFTTNIELQNEFLKSITVLSQKHLAFSANFLFRLLQKLADMIPSIVENSLPNIRDQVACVEARRGVGHDEGLRNSLRKVEIYIEKSKRRL